MIDELTLDFIKRHIDDDVRILALQAGRYPDVDMHQAVVQIEGRQHAVAKLPSWASVDGLLYPPRISMEQCSSEITAEYKASLMCGNSFADITGGFGIDCSFISRRFSDCLYVERDERLCRIAEHNFSCLGLKNIKVLNGDGTKVLSTFAQKDWIFVDPARRDHAGRKVAALCDCEPNVVDLQDLLLEKGKKVMIKSSPMLDITAACRLLDTVSDVHIVAVNNECKELLLVLSQDRTASVVIHCVNLYGGDVEAFTFHKDEENAATCSSASDVARFLYEPNAAVLKSGCFRLLCNRFGVDMLHANSRLFTSSRFVGEFPGRKFEVIGVCGFSKKELKETIGDLRQANITVRNFPDTVQQLRKRLKLCDGGDIYLFATTLCDGRKVIVKCRKVTSATLK